MMAARVRASVRSASEAAIWPATRFRSRHLSGFERNSANSLPICLVRSSSEMNFRLQVSCERMVERSERDDVAILACCVG